MRIRRLVYISLLFSTFALNGAFGQFFQTERVWNSQRIPCEGFLYKFSAPLVRQAAQNVFAEYEISTKHVEGLSYFWFQGENINPILLGKTKIVFWVEEHGDDKCVLYLSALNERTNAHAPAIRFSVIHRQIRDYLSAIESESIDISEQLFLSEQYVKVFRLSDELKALSDELRELEVNSPDATTQINQIRSAIRIKKAQLDEETNVLEQLKNRES